MGYLAGFDVGSSSVKGTLLEAETGRVFRTYTSPQAPSELGIAAPYPGWAEQDPETWSEHFVAVSHKLLEGVDPRDVKGIGISYQMHGLVLVDKDGKVLRPSIIWCDGRTQAMGEQAARDLGPGFLDRALNYPGNFTATKLAWVKANEPGVYAKVHKAMLPGDYIAMKLSGRICTTPSGLSEGVMWDFENDRLLTEVFDYYGTDAELMPEVVPTFSVQSEVTGEAEEATGFRKGTPIGYRAGDQANNALSLNVRNPGEDATTAGTSGVIYAVTDRRVPDPQSRVNVFVHVNHRLLTPRYGILGCINGTGILYRWLRDRFNGDYQAMNSAAEAVAAGSDGLVIVPYGNGPERTLSGRNTGMSMHYVDFNRHGSGHIARAAQEGIVFALRKATDIMGNMGASVKKVRAGKANMFQSDLFAKMFASAMGAEVELLDTDGSQGAARGAGIGTGVYRTPEEAFAGLNRVKTIEPDETLGKAYGELYPRWNEVLEGTLRK